MEKTKEVELRPRVCGSTSRTGMWKGRLVQEMQSNMEEPYLESGNMSVHAPVSSLGGIRWKGAWPRWQACLTISATFLLECTMKMNWHCEESDEPPMSLYCAHHSPAITSRVHATPGWNAFSLNTFYSASVEVQENRHDYSGSSQTSTKVNMPMHFSEQHSSVKRPCQVAHKMDG